MTLPPLHPILVNFTAALVPVSFVSDLLGRMLRKQSLHLTGWWSLCFAAIVTPFTVFAGWWWLRSMGGMDHWEMDIHKWLGTGLAAVFIMLVLWRARLHRRSLPPGAPYLIALGITVAALTFQGHLGGMMSFAPPQTDTTSPGPTPDGDGPIHHPHDATQPGNEPGWRDHIQLEG